MEETFAKYIRKSNNFIHHGHNIKYVVFPLTKIVAPQDYFVDCIYYYYSRYPVATSYRENC